MPEGKPIPRANIPLELLDELLLELELLDELLLELELLDELLLELELIDELLLELELIELKELILLRLDNKLLLELKLLLEIKPLLELKLLEEMLEESFLLFLEIIDGILIPYDLLLLDMGEKKVVVEIGDEKVTDGVKLLICDGVTPSVVL